MKKRSEKLFLILILVIQIILFGGMIIFTVTLTKKVSSNSREMLNEHALQVSEEHMRERVENVVSLIQQEEGKILREIDSAAVSVCEKAAKQEEEQLEEFLKSQMKEIANRGYGDLIQLVLYRKSSEQFMIYHKDNQEQIVGQEESEKVLKFVGEASYCKQAEFNDHTLYIISVNENVDQRTKDYIYGVLHAIQYGEDGYVWVNEVLSYEGGENYAIRRIHPNLKDTEGQYLSTDMQDIVGNLPYLKELEEINKEGEVFHTYYFKNRKDDQIREKASYAKLYEPYNWIIATGNPLDDVLLYSSALDDENQEFLSGLLFYTIIILILIFIGDVFLIFYNSKKIRERLTLEEKIATNERKLKQADMEAMTGLLRRGPGEQQINQWLTDHQDVKGIIVAVDLDDLKEVNDTLGHKAGDEAIIGIASTLKAHFRQTDILLRYGGDEFVVFMPNEELDMNIMTRRMESLVRKMSEISIGENKERNIHCSMGVASVVEKDTFKSLFSRADKALYHVKRNGKNNFAFYTEEMEKEDYSFRDNLLFNDIKNIAYEELLKVMFTPYVLVLSVNISKDTYNLLKKEDKDAIIEAPKVGYLSHLIPYLNSFVEPDEREQFMENMRRENLIKIYEDTRGNSDFIFRFSQHGVYRKGECVFRFYTNDKGDICALTTYQWKDSEV